MTSGPVWASAFPGDGTYLMTPGEAANMPASSPFVFIAMIYKDMIAPAFAPNHTDFIPIQNIGDNYFDNTVWLAATPWGPTLVPTGTKDAQGHDLYSNPTPGFMLAIVLSSDPNYTDFMSFTSYAPNQAVPNGFMLPDEGDHHLLLLGCDCQQGICLGSLDGSPFPLIFNRSSGNPFSVSYGYPWAIGAPVDSSYASNYQATHAYLGLMAPPSFVDPTDPNVIAHFWDSKNNIPFLPDQSGGVLLADYGAQFQIWLQGAPPAFIRNPTNNQTQFGITRSDPNNEFQEVGGEGLIGAVSSPWG